MLVEPREALSRSSTFTLAAAAPRQINLRTVYEGDATPVRTEGIYALSGDTLTYCVAAPGRPRPTEFATVQGDGNTFVTLARFKLQMIPASASDWQSATPLAGDRPEARAAD